MTTEESTTRLLADWRCLNDEQRTAAFFRMMSESPSVFETARKMAKNAIRIARTSARIRTYRELAATYYADRSSDWEIARSIARDMQRYFEHDFARDQHRNVLPETTDPRRILFWTILKDKPVVLKPESIRKIVAEARVSNS